MRTPVLSHLGTGLMALILAVILWAFAYVENREEISVACEVRLDPPAEFQVSPKTQTIELTISGPRRLVEVFRGQPLTIVKRVSRTEVEQSGGVVVTAEDFNADKRLRIDKLPWRISPVTLSEQIEISLPVRFKTTGSPVPGYVFRPDRSSVQPPTVLVKGPRELLERPDAAMYTNSIELVSMWCAGPSTLIPCPASIQPVLDGKPVTLDNTRATVYIAIEQQLGSRTFPEVPVSLLLPQAYPYKVTLNRPLVRVTVEGPEQRLLTILPESIMVFARVDELDTPDTPGNLPRIKRLSMLLPPGLTGKTDPESVDLTVTAP